MFGEDRALAICLEALGEMQADQAEAVLMAHESALTRYANSGIHQNVAEVDATLNLRAVLGKRIGVAAGNDLSAQGIWRLAEEALEIARHQLADEDFLSLPSPEGLPTGLPPPDPATRDCPPERRAEGVRLVVKGALAAELTASGAFSTSGSELAVANSLGVRSYSAGSSAQLTAVVTGDTGSGYADAVGRALENLDASAVAAEAVERARRAQDPVELEPAAYDVVLEPYAVSEMLDYLSHMGFSALALQEGRSFLRGKLGQRIVSDQISIWDDATDPGGLPQACDYEGVPKRKVDLIRQGVAIGPVYDSYTAGREGRASTGHGLPAPNTFGPFAGNLRMAPGQASRDDLLATLDRGLWISRFHYVNVVHPLETTITGMTRDGTFLVEGGRLVRPVKNLRFTQSVLEALSNVAGVGRELKLEPSWGGANLVPALAIRGFRFTSATEH